MKVLSGMAAERLEYRHLLSATSILTAPWPAHAAGASGADGDGSGAEGDLEASSVAATSLIASPADHSRLTAPASEIRVSFPDTIDYLWTDGDIRLDVVAPDGSAAPYFGIGEMPPATFDPSGTTATIALDSPLPAGRYRIVLAGGSLESMIFSGGLWDDSSDQILSDFTVATQGATLDDATDMGTIGSQVVSLSDSLDLTALPNVKLYKVTLAPGHSWRLGVQVDAQSIGSRLLPALSLFDSAGNVLATRDIGTGRPIATNDPYLFAGLGAGTYYIGISGAGNLPGTDGGYDPIEGSLGIRGMAQPGGDFRLDVVADPTDSPTRVTGWSLHWEDSLDPSPTTLTVAFSGPIDPHSLLTDRPLVVVDSAGRKWPLVAIGYNEPLSQVTFAFGERLPAGSYTLVDPEGGLVDLTGERPVAAGLPAGSLATWTVASRSTPAGAGDLGVAWPSGHGLSTGLQVPAGQSRTLRVVIPVADLYSIAAVVNGGEVRITKGGEGGTPEDVAIDPETGMSFVFLRPGVYLFTFQAVGGEAASIDWQINGLPLSPESLVNNGIGQTSALSLRITGTADGGLSAANPPTLATVTPWTTAPTAPQSLNRGVNTVEPDVAGQGGASSRILLASSVHQQDGAAVFAGSLSMSLDSNLMGRPGIPGQSQPGVGLSAASGFVVQGNRAVTRENRASYPYDGPADPDDSDESEASEDGPVADRGSGADRDPAPADSAVIRVTADADDRAIRRADRLAEIADTLLSWVFPRSSGAADIGGVGENRAAARGAGDLGHALKVAGPGTPKAELHSGRIESERAGLVAPVSGLVAAAAAYRLHQLSAKWWRRTGSTRPIPQPRGINHRPHWPRNRPMPVRASR
ncbi:copper resistance protein CopC [Aquisphaera insulae]|uniref:copper resistance protein CopC n=1 Tax=Aquisphaera insulae TaxID=2712864 RepID=UPI0013EE32BE|nr:copper resistance protein CopC [Aquisphaera insulae]